MAFHPSGELFASASSAKQKQLKLYHLPTGTAFSNWPTNNTPLGRVNSLAFSSGGEYMAAGNTKGAVLLWNLKHFAN
jgi:U3 small nucleolar RNA-associated protein 18